ncbi:hypothetical protein [uncultured Ilyobacter sp.]|uniref:hypothetical protein n=1 Tax=uncultured Ilyobacter sp. TaxID=544433 RepID=UPI0029C0F589|nr:hypothetical protein [uncultured Ilyobacter sp.]
MVRKIKLKKNRVSKDVGKELQKAREKSTYIKNLRKKYPLSKPCTYWDDNRDMELEEKGRELLVKGDLDGAKRAFEELLAISTYHHSPCEFLAYTLYLKEEEQEFREWLMDEVVKTAIFFFEEDTLDRDVLDQILENQMRMKEGKELIKWWE